MRTREHADSRGGESASLTGKVIAAAIEVHRRTGPGLFEAAYRMCLVHELRAAGLAVSEDHPVPLVYNGVNLDGSYSADLFIENHLIVDLEAVDEIVPAHSMRTLTLMKFAKAPVGLIINFNVCLLKHGVTRLSRSPR